MGSEKILSFKMEIANSKSQQILYVKVVTKVSARRISDEGVAVSRILTLELGPELARLLMLEVESKSEVVETVHAKLQLYSIRINGLKMFNTGNVVKSKLAGNLKMELEYDCRC